MKLYQVKSKDGVTNTFCLDYECPKEHIRDNLWMEADLRTLKRIDFPEGRFECSNLDGCYFIFFDGELIVSWDDGAASSYPEDLTWNRDISVLICQVERLKDLEHEVKMSPVSGQLKHKINQLRVEKL